MFDVIIYPQIASTGDVFIFFCSYDLKKENTNIYADMSETVFVDTPPDTFVFEGGPNRVSYTIYEHWARRRVYSIL